jgi:DNA topoisomerase I
MATAKRKSKASESKSKVASRSTSTSMSTADVVAKSGKSTAAEPKSGAKAAARSAAKSATKSAAKSTAQRKRAGAPAQPAAGVGGEQASQLAESGEAPKRRSRATTLLVVESPAKAHTIQKYLGSDYIVVASKGHIKDLPKRGGVDIDDGFKETYEVIQEKGKDETLRVIKDNARRVQRVLLATDPDREGEAIAWHLLEEVQREAPDVEVRRVLFNEITKKGVQEGIAAPRDLDPHLYEAQRTRRVLDRIGGYPLSNLLWKKLAFGLSAGRVQTPALRLIVSWRSTRSFRGRTGCWKRT